METLLVALKLVLYILGSISLVTLIVLIMKLISTIDKTNEILDDINGKVKTLDGLFDAITIASSTISSFGNKVVDGILSIVGRLTRKKKRKEEEEYE